MAAPVRLGRKRPLPLCPNPLFVRWLTEWRDEAASRGRRTQFVFQKALRSLRRYPLPLRSGKEAKILQHFGDGLCRMLDQRLQQHRTSGGDHAPGSPSGRKSPARERPPAEVQDSSMPVPTQRKAGGPGSYWPARHSGARAVLLLLYREHLNPSGHGFLTKEELLQGCAQKAPRVAPGSAQPWPALRSLLHRNLVFRTHRPARWADNMGCRRGASGARVMCEGGPAVGDKLVAGLRNGPGQVQRKLIWGQEHGQQEGGWGPAGFVV